MNKLTSKKKLWLGIGITSALIVIPTAIIVPIVLTTSTQPVVQKFRILDMDKSNFMFGPSGPWHKKWDLTPADFEEYGILEIGANAFNSKRVPWSTELRNIILPSDPNFIVRNGAFALADFLKKIFIPDEVQMEWMNKNEIGVDAYAMFWESNTWLELSLPVKYKDSATSRKIGYNESIFKNITWHGVYDPNTQVPM